MLTGDKVDTATNIAYGCSLFSTDMKLFKLTAKTEGITLGGIDPVSGHANETLPTRKSLKDKLSEYLKVVYKSEVPCGLVVDTYVLTMAMPDKIGHRKIKGSFLMNFGF